ncbi:hypothetical protein KY330_05185 [Candidatus Woesearchaeota archaeon]|nr:hypothetical protein [Candidatus Woesearchaeota archaeon]
MKVEYTDREKQLIKEYEEMTGSKIGTWDERLESFKQMTMCQRHQYQNNLEMALEAKKQVPEFLLGEHDAVMEKVVRESLAILEWISIQAYVQQNPHEVN